MIVGGEVKLKLFSLFFQTFGWFFIFCAGMAKLGYQPSPIVGAYMEVSVDRYQRCVAVLGPPNSP